MTATKEAARRFQFLREIASGGFGSVYLAKVVHADGFSRLVAVKLLHKRWSENEEIASRMRDEARLLGWLRHRNIVEVLDLTLIDGRSAVVMEYLEAVDTRVILEQCKEQGLEVPLGVALEVCASVASALDAAYNRPPYAGEKPLRVIHRDIKPSNVMVDENGIVKVLDFGVARAEFDAREAKTAELSFGSLEYMPPERLFFEPESPASDIYSLGSTLYEMLALDKLGKAKLRQSEQERFVAERFAELLSRRPIHVPELEDQLGELLQSMLAFDESDRPTAADLVARLRTFARQTGDPTIEEWAPKNIPALIEHVRSRQEEGGTMVGQTITEDVSGLRRELPPRPGDADDDTTGAQRTELFRSDDLEGPDSAEYTTGTGRDDARWSALKEATLASLSETGELNSRNLASLAGAAAGPTSLEEVTRPKGSNGPAGPASPQRAGTFEWLDDTTEPEDGAPTVRIRPGADPTPSLRPHPLAASQGSAGELRAPGSRPPSLPPGMQTLPPRSPLSEEETVNLAAQTRRLPTRSQPPPPVEAEPARGGSPIGLLLSIALLLVAAGVLFLALLIIGGAGIAALTTRGGGRTVAVPDPEPIVVPAPAPRPDPLPAPGPSPDPVVVAPTPTPTPTPAPAASSGTVFASRMANTKRMTVRCTNGSGQGEGEVAIDHPSPGECTVTAIDSARRRRTAVVKGVEDRRYECFAGAEDRCD